MTKMKYIACTLPLILCALLTVTVEAQTSTDLVNSDGKAVREAVPQATPLTINGSSDNALLTVTNSAINGTAISGDAPNGFGVRGSGAIGVKGDGGSAGTGVIGSSSGQGSGVSGTSNSGDGVSGYSSRGKAVYGTGGGYGVYGLGTTDTSTGVYGTGGSSGVVGISTGGYGVVGKSTNGRGISGESERDIGVFGSSNGKYGVYGQVTNRCDGCAGVVGQSIFVETPAGLFKGTVEVVGKMTIRDGCTGCSPPSDRNLKANFSQVSPRFILNRLATIPIQTWNYNFESKDVRHIGPVAQDFRAAFRLGDSDKTINTVDAQGVALAAIQGLYQMIQEKDRKIDQQSSQIEQLQNRMLQLERRVGERARGKRRR